MSEKDFFKWEDGGDVESTDKIQALRADNEKKAELLAEAMRELAKGADCLERQEDDIAKLKQRVEELEKDKQRLREWIGYAHKALGNNKIEHTFVLLQEAVMREDISISELKARTGQKEAEDG